MLLNVSRLSERLRPVDSNPAGDDSYSIYDDDYCSKRTNGSLPLDHGVD